MRVHLYGGPCAGREYMLYNPSTTLTFAYTEEEGVIGFFADTYPMASVTKYAEYQRMSRFDLETDHVTWSWVHTAILAGLREFRV